MQRVEAQVSERGRAIEDQYEEAYALGGFLDGRAIVVMIIFRKLRLPGADILSRRARGDMDGVDSIDNFFSTAGLRESEPMRSAFRTVLCAITYPW